MVFLFFVFVILNGVGMVGRCGQQVTEFRNDYSRVRLWQGKEFSKSRGKNIVVEYISGEDSSGWRDDFRCSEWGNGVCFWRWRSRVKKEVRGWRLGKKFWDVEKQRVEVWQNWSLEREGGGWFEGVLGQGWGQRGLGVFAVLIYRWWLLQIQVLYVVCYEVRRGLFYIFGRILNQRW